MKIKNKIKIKLNTNKKNTNKKNTNKKNTLLYNRIKGGKRTKINNKYSKAIFL